MTDTYRNHLLQRVRGTPGGVPLPPVAQIASNAARETAARIAVALRPTQPTDQRAQMGYAQQDARVHGTGANRTVYDPTEAPRRMAEYQASQLAQEPVDYGGSTPGAVPVAPEDAQQDMQRRSTTLAGLMAGRTQGPPTRPSDPGYYGSTQQQVDVAAIPTGAPQLASEMTPNPERTTTNVPQWQDIKFFEENTQLPTGQMPLTPEDKAAQEVEVTAGQTDIVDIDKAEADLQVARDYYMATGSEDAEAQFKTAQATYDAAVAAYGGSDPLTASMDIIDKARQWNVSTMGDGAYNVATGKAEGWDPGWGALAPANWMIPGLDATRFNQDFQVWVEDPNNWQAIRNAYENGFQATETDPVFTGGRAVWELFINGGSGFYKFLSDLLNDPTIVVGAGKAVGDDLIESALRGAADENLATNIMKRTAGQLLSAPQTVLDKTVDAPFNVAGKWVSDALSNKRVLRGTLLEHPVKIRETEQVNTTYEDIGHQDRIRREGVGLEPLDGDDPTGGGGFTPEPPLDPNTPRYTKTYDSQANVWVIVDPNGNVVPGEVFEFKPKKTTDTEPNFQERAAQKRVNELNRPIIREEDLAAGAILPPEGELTWTDPAYQRLTNKARNQPTPIQTQVADAVDVLPTELRQKWMDEWTPKAKEHEAVMADFTAEEKRLLNQKPGAIELENMVQKGQQMLYPAKIYEMVRFYVDDTLLPFRETFPGVAARTRPWITEPVVDRAANAPAVNLIEHAVFGTREDAIYARKMLRSRTVTTPGMRYQQFVESLAEMGERINGPGWRSSDPSAVKSRGIRARQAGEPLIDEAAVGEVVGRAPSKAQLLKDRTNRINSGSVYREANRIPDPEVEQAVADLVNAPATDHNKIVTQIALDDAEDALTREISDPATKSVTPGKNRIESKVPGEVVVRKPGSMKTNYVRIIRGDSEWRLIPREGEKEAIFVTLSDAIEVADEILARYGKGIDPVPAQVKRATDSLGIVPPGVARNINMEGQVREDILRKTGTFEGPGQDDLVLMSRNDLSYVGAAHQMGKITDATYRNLSRWVNYEGQQMKLWEAYDRALLWNPGDPIKAKQDIAKIAVDASIANEIAAGTLKKENRTKATRAAYAALSAYQTTINAQREMIMFNWARGFGGAFADWTGTNYSLILHGEFGAVRRNMPFLGATRHFINDERGKKLAMDALPGMERYKYLTGAEPPSSVMKLMETRFETPHGKLQLQRLPGPLKALTRPLADPYIMAFRNGLDRNIRYGLHMAAFDRNIKHAQNQFRGVVASRAKRTEHDYVDWLHKLDRLGNDYNPDDVLKVFGDKRLARDWAEMINLSKLDSKNRVDQLLFSYKGTNLDNKLRNVIFFHYWMSRALPLHAKVAFKNPWMLSAYQRAWEHMQREAEQNGYPPSVRGFIRMMGDDTGFYGLISPVNVLVPFSMLLDNNDDPGVFAFLKRWGLFINPLVEAAAASLGWANTMPDITATLSVRRALRYTVNWLNSNGFDGLVPNILGGQNTWQPSILDEAQYRAIEGINNLARRAADTLAPSQQIIQDFEGSSRNAYEYDVLNSILINELEKRHGLFETWGPESPAWQEFLDARDDIAMGRDGNVIADSVVEAMADAKMENTIAASIIPGGVYQRYGPRDETLAEARAGEEQAWDQRALATGGNPELTVDLLQLERLGTENGRQGYALWNEIAYADDFDDQGWIELNGELIAGWTIKAMTDDQRERLADKWLAQYEGVPEEVESYRVLRSDFLDANPQAGDFKEYQKGVGNYEGGTSKWRETYAIKDTAFGDAMSKQEAKLRAQGKTGDVLSKELDQWAMTPEAYNVANGIQNEIYDSPATAKVPDYGFETGEASAKKSTAKDPMTKLADDITAYQEKLTTALDSMRASGYAVSEEDVYAMSPFYATIFKQFGVPTASDDVMLFLQWAGLPENQGRNSVDEFIAYLEDLGQKAA